MSMYQLIRRSPYQSLATFIILTLTSFMILLFFWLTAFSYSASKDIETKPLLFAFFQTTIPEQNILEVKRKLEATGMVKEMKYVSQDEALDFYRKANADDELLLELVTKDILPASLEMRAHKAEDLGKLEALIKQESSIESVQYAKEDVRRIVAATATWRQVTFIFFIVMLLVTLLVLITTTALKIAMRRDEINLLQLLGATNWYIRAPYVKEGLLYGLVSGSLAFVIGIGVMYQYVSKLLLATSIKDVFQLNTSQESLVSFFNLGDYGFSMVPPSIPFLLVSYALLLVFTSCVGMIGNYFAASKYIS